MFAALLSSSLCD